MLCFSPSKHKSCDNHHHSPSECRNLRCFKGYTYISLDHKMQVTFTKYFLGKKSASHALENIYMQVQQQHKDS